MWRCLRASTLWHISENARCLISVVESKGHPRVSRSNACILFIESSLCPHSKRLLHQKYINLLILIFEASGRMIRFSFAIWFLKQ